MGRFFNKGRDIEDEFDNEEDESSPEFYYDEELDAYISTLDGKSYTAEELNEMGYDIEIEDDSLDDDSLDDDSLTEEVYSEDELEEEVEGDYVEEVEGDLDGESDEVGYYYGDDDEEPKSRNLMKAFGVMGVIVAVALVIYFFLPKVGGDEKVSSNINIDRATEILELMYDNDSIDDLINKNDRILEYFDEVEHPYLDIRDDDIYMVRYAEFSNNHTSLTMSTIVESEENEVIARYQITNEVDLPSDRIATFVFDDRGIISNFKEERVYKVIDR